MYLLFKSVDQRQLGIVQVVGTWMDFSIGYLPDSHVNIAEYRHLNPRILTEDVAYAYMFIGAYRGTISVRPATNQNERLNVVRSEEATGEKVKYTLTDDDNTNATKIMQEIMRHIIDDVYDKRMLQLSLNVSNLEKDSWEEQKREADAYTLDNSASCPLLQNLATARGITLAEMVAKVNAAVAAYNTQLNQLLANKQSLEAEVKACENIADCCRLMHNKFEVQMSLAQATDEGITTSSIFDI